MNLRPKAWLEADKPAPLVHPSSEPLVRLKPSQEITARWGSLLIKVQMIGNQISSFSSK